MGIRNHTFICYKFGGYTSDLKLLAAASQDPGFLFTIKKILGVSSQEGLVSGLDHSPIYKRWVSAISKWSHNRIY